MEVATALAGSAILFSVSVTLLLVMVMFSLAGLFRRRRSQRNEEEYKALVRRAGGRGY